MFQRGDRVKVIKHTTDYEVDFYGHVGDVFKSVDQQVWVRFEDTWRRTGEYRYPVFHESYLRNVTQPPRKEDTRTIGQIVAEKNRKKRKKRPRKLM